MGKPMAENLLRVGSTQRSIFVLDAPFSVLSNILQRLCNSPKNADANLRFDGIFDKLTALRSLNKRMQTAAVEAGSNEEGV